MFLATCGRKPVTLGSQSPIHSQHHTQAVKANCPKASPNIIDFPILINQHKIVLTFKPENGHYLSIVLHISLKQKAILL